MQEVCGAIQGVNDPLVFIAFLKTAFLGQDAVTGKCLAQGKNDFLFSLPVNLGDEIVPVFCMYGQCVQFSEVTNNDVTGAACGTDGDVEGGIHDVFLCETQVLF